MHGPPRRPTMSSPGNQESQIVSPGPEIGTAGEPGRPLTAASIWQLVKLRSEADPDRILAVDEKGSELSYGQLPERAEAVAAAPPALSIAPGDVVSWPLPPRLPNA